MIRIAIFFLALSFVVSGCGENDNRSSGQALPRDSNVVSPVKQSAGTESELAECENLARRKGVQLSGGGLRTRDLGGEMHWYGASTTYRGKPCSFVCLFWGGEMDSAACMGSSGVVQEELFCANPPCFR